MFDPEAFGRAMGETIRKAVEPLHAEIAALKSLLAERPDFSKTIAEEVKGQVALIAIPKDGKDCDMEAVKAMVSEAVKAIPVVNGKDGSDGSNGKDGTNGENGKSVTIDEVAPLIDQAVKSIRADADETLQAAIKAIPVPKDGRDGTNGSDGRDGTSVTVKELEPLIKDAVRNWTEGLPVPKDGKDGERGEKGVDGLGLAGAMIDRDGSLQITLTNGEVKSLGAVVGKDGTNGVDGIGFESFELEYLPESHEIAVKASAAGRVKELRYPAGGIRPGNYWREGTKAKAAEAWVHDGSLWIATKDTSTKPETAGSDWIIAARKGRDGERGQKGLDGSPPAPIKLKD